MSQVGFQSGGRETGVQAGQLVVLDIEQPEACPQLRQVLWPGRDHDPTWLTFRVLGG